MAGEVETKTTSASVKVKLRLILAITTNLFDLESGENDIQTVIVVAFQLNYWIIKSRK